MTLELTPVDQVDEGMVAEAGTVPPVHCAALTAGVGAIAEGVEAGTLAPVLLVGPPTPLPDSHAPRTLGEVRLWLSFAFLRADPNGPLDVKLVATRIGMSRTAIAYDGCAHQVLRKAVLDERAAREETRAAAAAKMQAARAGPARPKRGTRYWQAIAQRADSRIVEYAAQATREAAKSRRARDLLRQIFDDMKAGRWKRVDEEAVMMTDLAAELGPAGGA